MPATSSALSGASAQAIFTIKKPDQKKQKYKETFLQKNNLKIISAIEKYKRRGFEFANAEYSRVKIRALNDDDALLIDYGKLYHEFISEYRYPMLSDMLNERRENISGISWTEFNSHIVSFQSVLESYFHTKKITFTGSELPMSSHRRLGNIITARVKNPDKLRSTDYCSSIKKRECMNELMNRWAMHVMATSGTTGCYFKDATLWAWAL